MAPRYSSFITASLTLARRKRLLDSVVVDGIPDNFLQQLKHYLKFDSRSILTPYPGIRRFIQDFHPSDNTFLNEYKWPECLLEALNDTHYQSIIQTFTPIRIELEDVHNMYCSNPNCPVPQPRVVTSDKYTTIHMDLPTPTSSVPLGQLISNYFANGYDTSGTCNCGQQIRKVIVPRLCNVPKGMIFAVNRMVPRAERDPNDPSRMTMVVDKSEVEIPISYTVTLTSTARQEPVRYVVNYSSLSSQSLLFSDF